MNTTTLAEVIDRHGIDVLAHLDREVSVPVVAGLQAQGDVIVIPTSIPTSIATAPLAPVTPVPAGGIAVVRGENGGNTHLLLAEGDVRFDACDTRAGDLDLGTLHVTDGATAYLAHPEHGYAGIAPGTYVVRRQREQADQIRLVQD